MKWRNVYRVIPVPIFYTDKMPEDVGGYSKLFWICIRPKFELDEGIHQHELEHARQFWTLPLVHGLLYQASDRYRLWAEVQAYKKQMLFPDRNGTLLPLASAAARLMSPRYGLGLTLEKAMEHLQ